MKQKGFRRAWEEVKKMKAFCRKSPKENPKKEVNGTSPVGDKYMNCDSSSDDFQDLFSVLRSVNGEVFEGWSQLADGHKALGLSVNEVAKLAGVISSLDVYEEKIGKFVYSSFSEVASIEDDVKKSTIFRCIEFLAGDSNSGILTQENLEQQQDLPKKGLSSEFDEKTKYKSKDGYIHIQENSDEFDAINKEEFKPVKGVNENANIDISPAGKNRLEIASARNNILNLLQRQRQALHYSELDALYLIEYGNKISTTGFLRNTEDSIELFPGVFFHSKNFSINYEKKFLEEKKHILNYVINRLQAENDSLSISSLSDGYRKGNESRCLTGVAVSSALRAVVSTNKVVLLEGERVKLRSCLTAKQGSNAEQDRRVGEGSKKENGNSQFEKRDASVERIRELNRKTQNSDAIVAGEKLSFSKIFSHSEKEACEVGDKSAKLLRKMMRSDKPENLLSENLWSEWSKALEGYYLKKQKVGVFSRKLKLICPVVYENKTIEEFLNLPYGKICAIESWEAKKSVIVSVASVFCLFEIDKQKSEERSLIIDEKENIVLSKIKKVETLKFVNINSKNFVEIYKKAFPNLFINTEVWSSWRNKIISDRRMAEKNIGTVARLLGLYWSNSYEELKIHEILNEKYEIFVKEYDYETLRTIIIAVAYLVGCDYISRESISDCVKYQKHYLSCTKKQEETIIKEELSVGNIPCIEIEDSIPHSSSEKIVEASEGNIHSCKANSWISKVTKKALSYDYLLGFEEPWLHVDNNTWDEWRKLALIRCPSGLGTKVVAKRLGLFWPRGSVGRPLKNHLDWSLEGLCRLGFPDERKTIFMEVAYFAFNEKLPNFSRNSCEESTKSSIGYSIFRTIRLEKSWPLPPFKDEVVLAKVANEVRTTQNEPKTDFGGLLGEILSDFEF